MASEDEDNDLGVLDELLQHATVTEVLTVDAPPAEDGPLVMSADEILQQLDSVTQLEAEEEWKTEASTEQAQSTGNATESQSAETPSLETSADDVAVEVEQLQSNAAEDEPPVALDTDEDTFHEAETFAGESADASAEHGMVHEDAANELTEAVAIVETTATKSTLEETATQHGEEHGDVEVASGVPTEPAELLQSEPLDSPPLETSVEEARSTADSVFFPSSEANVTASAPFEGVADDMGSEEQVITKEEPDLSPSHEELVSPQSRHDSSSSDGSWEAVATPPPPPSPPVADHEGLTAIQPPPAPQPLYSGSLNPTDWLMSAEGDGNESDSDDSGEEDSGDGEGEATLPPPPLQLSSAGEDDDEELEVDPVVAEEIRATKTATPPTHSTSALLDALTQADGVAKQLTADVMQAHASKMDEIALSFDAEPPVEVRAAQVVATQAHPDSSATMFGIGYQSMRKRGDHSHNGEAERDAYTVAKGPMFHELESEVTLTGDVSLSLAQSQQNGAERAGDDDEFGEILSSVDGPVSPTRVDAIIQKTMASRSHDDDEQRLLSELKKATHEEKLRLNQGETNSQLLSDSTSKREVDDNALTLKELHSIYKRGLGDQEVLMMGDDEGSKNVSASVSEEVPSPALSVMGRLLSKHVITEEAEEDEEEEDDDRKSNGADPNRAERSSLDEEDADAVTVDSDRMILMDGSDFGGQSSETTQRAPAEKAEDEWREIQLLRQASTPSSPVKSESAPSADSSSCSKISYSEALDYFLQSEDVLEHLDHIVTEEKAPSTSCFGCLTRPRLAFPDSINQRDRFFCVAATPFDPRNNVHVRMLQTIYRQILHARGSKRDVPLMGVHWESIGFQGSDPTTDLRGCGVLSLLQLLHLVEAHAELARSFHSLSQHAVRHFPMACASINITLQCLVALRSGALYRECNKRTSVFAAANALHVALTHQLMKELQTSGDEIPIVMKRVLDHGRLHPDKVLELHAASSASAFKHAVSRQESHSTAQPSPRKASTTGRAGRASSSHVAAEFTEIGLHSVDDD